MSRLLFYIAIAAVAYYFYRTLRRPKSEPPRRMQTEDTVRCEYCGVHLPSSEAVSSNEHHFCSEEHRRLAQLTKN